MNQRANYAFLSMFPLFGFVISHKNVTKDEPETKSAALFRTVINFSGSVVKCLHFGKIQVNS